MANRRCLRFWTRYFQSFKTLNPLSHTRSPASIYFLHQTQNPKPINRICEHLSAYPHCYLFSRHFSSTPTDDDEDTDESDDEAEETEIGDEEAFLSPEDKEREADEIGYKVMGPLQESDLVFKPYEPIFAIVQIGSHQFKVSNGDSIFTERLKFCDVNDKLILNKVLMLGSKCQTIIGRPVLPDAAVHAVVEEHALDAKVIIFKKKRRKNYRRTKGHRQELTKLRITDIQGIEKPEKVIPLKTEKKEKLRKLAIEAI
ncbi:large ribosomal subunit protein bL21m-like [Primulina eburnea]|uniref:large ribosomal subunit protein bL21m-like n=1 Tax=Primulina eburnea TaxID=1245227 RepID=UPI003C6C4F1E